MSPKGWARDGTTQNEFGGVLPIVRRQSMKRKRSGFFRRHDGPGRWSTVDLAIPESELRNCDSLKFIPSRPYLPLVNERFNGRSIEWRIGLAIQSVRDRRLDFEKARRFGNHQYQRDQIAHLR